MAKPTDPLAAMLARKHITPAQYAAGRRWQQADAETAERCRTALGAEGTALLRLVLGGQSLIAIAAARGFDARPGSSDLIYLGRRLREALTTLAFELARPPPRRASRKPAGAFCRPPDVGRQRPAREIAWASGCGRQGG